MHISLDTEASQERETLEVLLVRLMDPGISFDAKDAIAAILRERYPVNEHVAEYTYVACYAREVSDAVVSFTLRLIYVYGCKFPDASEPIGTFVNVMKEKRRSKKLRTQAFMHLLLTNVVAAESAALLYMPEVAQIATTERCYPTFRRDDADSVYEEAMLKKLFH